MTTSEMLFYYDQVVRQVVKLKPNVTPPSTYILITEQYAETLAQGERDGGIIYINTAGMPAVFTPPPKPTLKWDEKASLTPVTVTEGVAQQIWIVDKLTREEKLAKLKEVRDMYLYTIPFEMAIATPDEEGNTVYKPCVTDPGTVQMFTLSVITSQLNPGYVFRSWKFDGPNGPEWYPVKGSDLTEAWRGVSIEMERQFEIEDAYSSYIMADIEIDITPWELVPKYRPF